MKINCQYPKGKNEITFADKNILENIKKRRLRRCAGRTHAKANQNLLLCYGHRRNEIRYREKIFEKGRRQCEKT